VNGRYAIMENIAAPGTATPMHFHAEDEFFHILEGTVTFSIDGNVSMPETWCHALRFQRTIWISVHSIHSAWSVPASKPFAASGPRGNNLVELRMNANSEVT